MAIDNGDETNKEIESAKASLSFIKTRLACLSKKNTMTYKLMLLKTVKMNALRENKLNMH